MQQKGPSIATRAQRARHILARIGVLTVVFSLACGCASMQLRPEQEKRLAVLQCQLDAVLPLVGSEEAAEAIVLAARAGDFERALKLVLGVGAEAAAVAQAYDSCNDAPPPAPPAPEAKPTRL